MQRFWSSTYLMFNFLSLPNFSPSWCQLSVSLFSPLRPIRDIDFRSFLGNSKRSFLATRQAFCSCLPSSNAFVIIRLLPSPNYSQHVVAFVGKNCDSIEPMSVSGALCWEFRNRRRSVATRISIEVWVVWDDVILRTPSYLIYLRNQMFQWHCYLPWSVAILTQVFFSLDGELLSVRKIV